jgi:proteasome lid subunit RPN8/RPN11
VSVLEIERKFLDETLEQLQVCGAGRTECVAYWVGDRIEPQRPRRLVHPLHRADNGGYQVDSQFVNELFLSLRKTGEFVRAQVHSHPRAAFHSRTDDQFCLTPSAGFVSLVVPNFANGPVDLSTWYLTEMQEDGTWRELDVGSALVLM